MKYSGWLFAIACYAEFDISGEEIYDKELFKKNFEQSPPKPG